MKLSRFDELREQKPILIIDGAMGTQLEARGHDVNDDLWSAKILAEDPAAIEQIHYDYFKAGADIGMSCSYQATIPGFMSAGYSQEEAEDLIRLSMKLLIDARERWWNDEGKDSGRPYPLVCGDIGPYGAYITGGEEYIGSYHQSEEEYREFHLPRIKLLMEAGAEFFVCETIPKLEEAVALGKMLDELEQDYWLTFTFKDGQHISEGKTIPEVVEAVGDFKHLKGIGANCIPPAIATEIVETFKRLTHIPVVIYPNTGEVYDGHKRIWLGDKDPRPFGARAVDWKKAGATVIGGCCRTSEKDIIAICENVL